MKAIFTLAAIGAAATSAIAYSTLPVLAPGAMLLSANLGLLSGGLMGLAVKSFHSDHEGIAVLGTIGSVISSLAAGGFAIYQSVNSFDTPMEGALEKAIVQTYGGEMEGLKAGHRIVMGVDLLGEESLPMIATAKTDRAVYLMSSGDGGRIFLKFCADFDVARKGEEKSGDEVSMCTTRYLKPEEVLRILKP